jgi:hypothetical protein
MADKEPSNVAFVRAASDVRTERNRQDVRWGESHDDAHSLKDWTAILTRLTGGVAEAALDAYSDDDNQALFYEHLKRVAATAQAAMEALRRQGLHE